MLRLLLILICTWALFSCRSSNLGLAKTFRESIPVVSFCDLPKYKGRPVYLRAYYSGIDEYWSLENIERKNCNPKLSVDLQYAGYNPFNPPEKFEKVFREAFDNYYNTYVLIEAVGVFENDSQTGYGHLGSNNSRFVVSELINATLIKK